MKLFHAIRSLFRRPRVSIFAKAKTSDQMMDALQTQRNTNRVELRRIEDEIGRLTTVEEVEITRIRTAGISDRKKRITLHRILHLRKQIKAFDDKMAVHTKNITLLEMLASKIQISRSMSMQGVTSEEIDQIGLAYDENVEQFRNVLEAGNANNVDREFSSSDERLQLDDLEQEILEYGSTLSPAEHDAIRALEAEILGPPQEAPEEEIPVLEEESGE